MLPGFTLLRTLGEGGAALVYLARQEALDREVAVKVLRRGVEEPKVWRRFLREAQTVARLSGHPNVVTVYTAGESETGQPYLVTEYLDRGSLADVIAGGGPLPPATVAKIGVAVADALTAAHALGILHRDVKPGNVLLDHAGHVKLGDFGIARLLAAQSVTTTDVIAFTPEHVAPEVLRGEPDGPWSDLYGLASTLATALVGAPLFTSGPDERVDALLSRKLTAPPPPLPPSVPEVLAAPINQALDTEPTRRPSLAELRDRLAAAASVLGAAVPLPAPAPAPAAGATVAADATPDDDRPGAVGPLIGPLHRGRRRALAIPALVAAAVAGALAVGVLAAGDDPDEDATGATSPTVAAIPDTARTSPASTASPTAAAPPATVRRPAAPAPPTTAPPTTTTPPPTTPPPTTTPPTTTPPTTTPPPTTTVPPAPPPVVAPGTEAESGALLSAAAAEQFVRSYYDAVAARDYDRSWAQLAPEFQRGMARSYEYYVGFWDDNDIAVGDVELVDADPDRAVVNVELRWNGSDNAVTDQFTLRRGAGGEPLIAAQENIDG